MFSRSQLRGQPQRWGVGKSRTTFAGYIMRRPGCLINTLRGGSNKSPRLVPGGSGVWLSWRVRPALMLLCSTTAPLCFRFADNFRGHQFPGVYSVPSVIPPEAPSPPFRPRLWMKGCQRREGRWVCGCEVASHKGERHRRGGQRKGCSWHCVISFIRWETKGLERGMRAGGRSCRAPAEGGGPTCLRRRFPCPA